MRNIVLTALLLLAATGCGDAEGSPPWLDLPDDAGVQLVESRGVGGGQIVVSMDPPVTRDQALALGALILDQAPADATINARIYNDEATARNWSTVAAQWTNEHLLVVATRTRTGGDEVRWVGPEEEVPAAETPDSTEPTDQPS